MNQLVFFVEEASAKAMLEGILPRLLPSGVDFRIIAFEGKSDLEKQLERKIRGWLAPDTNFVVLRDKDQGDCIEIKAKLTKICQMAGRADTLVRIVCHELESWYLGDLSAVEAGLGVAKLAVKQANKRFRNPDEIVFPKETLKKLTKYKYQQIQGSRQIGVQLSLEHNRSHSFMVFLSGIRKVVHAD